MTVLRCVYDENECFGEVAAQQSGRADWQYGLCEFHQAEAALDAERNKAERAQFETKVIPLTECRRGVLYRLKSRNLVVGVFNGDTGFVGVREKFGELYLFTEYHYDTGPPLGTATPQGVLAECPFEDLSERHLRVVGEEPEGESTPEWAEAVGTRYAVTNRSLFDWMLPYSDAEAEQHRVEWAEWEAAKPQRDAERAERRRRFVEERT